VENVKWGEGLWGSPALFLGAVVLGWAAFGPRTRRVVLKNSSHLRRLFGTPDFLCLQSSGGRASPGVDSPGGPAFRPGGPGHLLHHGPFPGLAAGGPSGPPGEGRLDLTRFWPVVALAVLLGYSGEMIFSGAPSRSRSWPAISGKRNPWPSIPPSPKCSWLTGPARGPGPVHQPDCHGFFLIHGALRLGAVYYNPALGDIPPNMPGGSAAPTCALQRPSSPRCIIRPLRAGTNPAGGRPCRIFAIPL
jgi:hypothetical protein